MTDHSHSIRSLTAEDLFGITVISDPQASPDGSKVAWVQTRPSKESDSYLGALWLSDADGSNARQLTNGASRDSSPRWSPDSTSIAFISNRPAMIPFEPASDDSADDKSSSAKSTKAKPLNQVWTIAISGGEAIQRSNHPGGSGQPAWSPDGAVIAFVGKDKVKKDDAADAPTSVGPIADERVITEVTYRFDGNGFRDAYNHIWVVNLPEGTQRQLTSGFQNDSEPAWSPTGDAIAFSGNRSEITTQTWTRSNILSVSPNGGDVSLLTPEDASFATPSWSPDGKTIAFLGHLGTASGSNTSVWTVDPSGENLTQLTEGVDISFSDEGMSDVFAGGDGSPKWRGDNAIHVLASQRGETQVYEIVSGKKPKAITNGEHRIAGFTHAGDSLVVLKGTTRSPFALELWGGNGSFPTANAAFEAEVGLAAAQPLNVKSADGTEIQGWIIPPFGYDSTSETRHPLIVQIHGGPHAMYGHAVFHEMQLMAARGYAVAFCNPRGSSGYGEAFTTSTKGTWGDTDMPDVIALTEAAAALPWIDEKRLGVTGGSYGGYLTNWIIGHDTRFKAAVTQRCLSSFASFFGTSDIGTTFGVNEFDGLPWSDHEKLLKHSPIAYVDKITTPLLIIHSEQDLRCPIEQAEQLFTSLKYLGREVKFIRFPEESHDLSRSGTPSRRLARLHHLIGWFDAHL